MHKYLGLIVIFLLIAIIYFFFKEIGAERALELVRPEFNWVG